MITIRGKTFIPKPMRIADAIEVKQDLLALTTPEAKADPVSAATLPHILRVVQAALRRDIPDVTLEEISDALDINNLTEVVLAIIPLNVPMNIHSHAGHA